MKNFILILVSPILLSSCYAFLKADKLVYAGTLAKRPVTVEVDTNYQVEIQTEDINLK